MTCKLEIVTLAVIVSLLALQCSLAYQQWKPSDSNSVFQLEAIKHQPQEELTPQVDEVNSSPLKDWTRFLSSYGTAQCHEIPINMSLCSNVGYHSMILPNYLQHEDMDEVVQQSKVWINLVNTHCHEDLTKFLCSLYAPVCVPGHENRLIHPCKSLCEEVKSECLPKMLQFSFSWPEFLSCDRFPELANDLCIEPSTQKNSRCPGCLDEPSYDSLLTAYCTSEVVLRGRISNAYQLNPEADMPWTKRKSLRFGAGIKFLKSPRGLSATETNYRYRRQSASHSMPQLVEVSCDCPQLEATLSDNLNLQRRQFGRWLVMGKLSSNGSLIKAEYLTKLGKPSIKRLMRDIQTRSPRELCNLQTLQQPQAQAEYPRRYTNTNQQDQIRRKVRAHDAPKRNPGNLQAISAESSKTPVPVQISKYAPQQRMVMRQFALRIPEIERDKVLSSVENNWADNYVDR